MGLGGDSGGGSGRGGGRSWSRHEFCFFDFFGFFFDADAGQKMTEFGEAGG